MSLHLSSEMQTALSQLMVKKQRLSNTEAALVGDLWLSMAQPGRGLRLDSLEAALARTHPQPGQFTPTLDVAAAMPDGSRMHALLFSDQSGFVARERRCGTLEVFPLIFKLRDRWRARDSLLMRVRSQRKAVAMFSVEDDAHEKSQTLWHPAYIPSGSPAETVLEMLRDDLRMLAPLLDTMPHVYRPAGPPPQDPDILVPRWIQQSWLTPAETDLVRSWMQDAHDWARHHLVRILGAEPPISVTLRFDSPDPPMQSAAAELNVGALPGAFPTRCMPLNSLGGRPGALDLPVPAARCVGLEIRLSSRARRHRPVPPILCVDSMAGYPAPSAHRLLDLEARFGVPDGPALDTFKRPT